jgi:hypothetical protein
MSERSKGTFVLLSVVVAIWLGAYMAHAYKKASLTTDELVMICNADGNAAMLDKHGDYAGCLIPPKPFAHLKGSLQ